PALRGRRRRCGPGRPGGHLKTAPRPQPGEQPAGSQNDGRIAQAEKYQSTNRRPTLADTYFQFFSSGRFADSRIRSTAALKSGRSANGPKASDFSTAATFPYPSRPARSRASTASL